MNRSRAPSRCLAGLALLMFVGCTTRITPPAHLNDRVDVYLLDHGRTCSLVVPADRGRFVRYAYGDWNWYALDDTSFFSGFRALMWPTQGALGRRSFSASPTADGVRDAVPIEVEQLYVIPVERSRAQALNRSMDAAFAQNGSTLTDAPAAAMEFVHHPDRYWVFNNSNHAAADWLRQLGCTVRGPTLLSSWALRRP